MYEAYVRRNRANPADTLEGWDASSPRRFTPRYENREDRPGVLEVRDYVHLGANCLRVVDVSEYSTGESARRVQEELCRKFAGYRHKQPTTEGEK